MADSSECTASKSLNYEIRFIPTKRGGQALLYNGRKYHKKSTYADRNTFWQCYSKTTCKGSITLSEENFIVKSKYHNSDCLANDAKCIFEQELSALKKKVCTNNYPIQKQFDEMVSELNDKGVNFLHELPKFQNIKTGLYKERYRNLGVPKLQFRSPQEVIVPIKFKHLLIADYNDVDMRILVFGSPDTQQIIHRFQHFFLDGTFKSCPLPFKQLYSIHGFDVEAKKVVPIFFAFLRNKNERTYEILFRMIKNQIPSWKPVKMTLDYEQAAMKGVQTVFPDTIVKGCYFHFCNTLFRKSKALDMKSRIQRRHVARCAGLARLPLTFLKNGYEYVMKRSPTDEKSTIFNKYYQNKWMKDIGFVKKWCCEDEEIRTTNPVEAWHSRINKYVGRKNPNLAQILEVLEKETKLRNFKPAMKINKNYQEIDEEIKKTIAELCNNEITVGHCVEIIAPFSY